MSYTPPGAFLALLGSATSMAVGSGILFWVTAEALFRYFGWVGIGVLLVVTALLLFGAHLWLDTNVPKIKDDIGR